MKIHKEGYTIIAIALFLLLTIVTLSFFLLRIELSWAIIILSVFGLAFLIRFFRVPRRETIYNDELIYAPADGTVVAIEEVDEHEYLNGRCMQVSVFMSVWNIHVNWFPTSGMVKYYKYHQGEYLVAWHPKSSTHNERTSVAIERNDGVQILMRQIAGAIARRIVCYACENNQVSQCSELGFIKFGSRVDLFLPLDAKIKVEINQKVTGTQTVIAEIPSKN